MQKRKIIFIDIDGTLLPHGHKKIPIENVKAVKKLIEAGHKVVIATGQSISQAQKHLDDLGVDSHITADGQYITYENKLIYEKYLTEEEKTKALQELKKFYVLPAFQTLHGFYLKPWFTSWYIKKKLKKSGVSNVKISPKFKKTKNILNIWVFGSEKNLNKIESNKEKYEKAELLRWHKNFVQVILKNSGKAKAVEKILEIGQYDINQSYAIGDGKNDIQMLQKVKHSIGMGNATEEIKEIADFITTDCDKNGPENAFKHFGLI